MSLFAVWGAKMTFTQVTIDLFNGFYENLFLFFVTLLGAIPLGLTITFGSMSRFKPVKWLAKTFIWVIRGTPLMLQLFVVLYVPGLVFGVPMQSRMTAALVAFIINYAAYFSEIFRGGIESIPKGQYEACQVLGMTKTQTFFKVILMQLVKRIVPPMSNEIITLVKDTSLARIISVYEIIWAGQAFIKSNGILWPLLATGVFYLLFNGILTLVFGRIEKKLDYYHN